MKTLHQKGSLVTENDKLSGEEMPAQLEVNLPTEELQNILKEVFAEWELMKLSVQEQKYDIPRETGINELKSNVVTLVARKI